MKGGTRVSDLVNDYQVDRLRLVDTAMLKLAGDGPAGTPIGRVALEEVLISHRLYCVTNGELDPLQALGWGTNINRMLLSNGLCMQERRAEVWPKKPKLPAIAQDHCGICITVADAGSRASE